MKAKSGNDFIVNDEGTGLTGPFVHGLQKSFLWHDDSEVADNGFDEYGCDVVSPLFQCLFKRGQVIVRDGNDVSSDAFRDAGTVRYAECRRARPCGDKHQVGVAVVTSGKLYNFVPPRISACDADTAHDRLSAGVDKTDFFTRRNAVPKHACQLI